MSLPQQPLLALSQVARTYAVDPATLTRWILRGLRTPAGTHVCLAAVRLGGRWRVSEQALNDFFAALQPDSSGQAPTPPRSPAARRRQSEKAGKQLDAIGI